MSANELLQRLESLGIGLRAQDGRLQINAPRGRLTDEMKEALANYKTDLLEVLKARDCAATAELVALPRNGPLPLSFFQERLWVINRLEPGGTAYNLAALWPRNGPMNAESYAAAIAAVVRRHEILRASFVEQSGAPTVILLQPERVSIQIHDLGGKSDDEQLRILLAARDQATTTPFDLSSNPPARFSVYRLSTGGIVTLAVLHHIAIDAWSIGLLFREIDSTYDGATLEPPRLQYVDFAAWQRRRQDAAAIGPQLDWWAQRLSGIPQLSTFPPDYLPSPEPASPLGHVHGFRLGPELSRRLRALVREEGATLYMALLAACAVVLYRHTGQDDLVIGSPMGLRERPELETMIGPFVNLLLIRLDLSGEPSFTELLGRAREAVLEAHAHRHVPFETLLQRLKPVRSLQHSPLYQVAVVQHNAPVQAGLQIAGGGAIHELTWFVREVDGCLDASLEYRSDLFCADTIRRIAGHLEMVLAAAVEDRRQLVGELAMLTPDERRMLLEQFSGPAGQAIPDLFVARFEDQVARTPDAIAVTFEDQAISYRELNRRANRLAWQLRTKGVGRHSTVAVCLERSPALVVALLGVQKSGAAYLPLDPAFPAERLGFMLRDSDSTALVTAGEAMPGLELPQGLLVIEPEAAGAAADQASENPAVAPHPQDTAYIIYTSGSTGRPKGVLVSHAALANFLGSMQEEPGLSDGDVMAAVTTVSFDISALEIYLPLVVGARIELIPRHVATDGAVLAAKLESCGATVLQATPATWRLLLETDWRGRGFKALCGGEPLSRELADALLERVDELWNLYGPTETTIWSTVARVTRDGSAITVGRPIANTRIYVVDAAGRPVPVGVAGEIWIGGAGLAKGYHRRADLTAERFVADCFSPSAGARLYRTGDLGRWSPDGRLQHLGRMDHQVKIRGFRIELGEIEAVLCTHSSIRQAVATASAVGPGDYRLVVHVVYLPGQDLTVSEVRRHLRRLLPDYMIPSVVVAVDAIPLTPNGKVDRSALPDPFKEAMQPRAFEPPAPGMEQVLAGIWQRILQVGQVGAEDNFFELGGHSLLSLRVAAAFRKLTGKRIDPRALFFQSLRQVAIMAERDDADMNRAG